MSDYNEIRNALSHIDAHDRDTWIQVGAALKDEMGDDGFNLWDNWSQSADNYNARDAKTAWKSFKPGRVHISTLFYHARRNGYTPSQPYTPPTPEQQAVRAAELAARRQAEEQAQAEAQAKAKETARRIWNRSAPARADHPYLAAKGITSAAAVAGLRQNRYRGDDNLVVPLYYGGEIVNVQSINQSGHKRFLSGGQVKGGYAVVGNAGQLSDGLVIAEGYATAASIHQATGKPVIVAFNAGNMVAVSERLAQNLPAGVPVVLAADNDASQTGIHKARQAAAWFGGHAVAVQPEFTMTQIQAYQNTNGPNLPSDFNDLHQLAGTEAVRGPIEAAFRRPQPAPEAGQEVNGPRLQSAVRPSEGRPEAAQAIREPRPAAAAAPETEPPRPAAAPTMSDEEWAAVVAEEARLSGYPAPPPAETPSQAAPTGAASLQEHDMDSKAQTQTEPRTAAAAAEAAAAPEAADRPSENNTIEYAALRRTREPEPHQSIDPGHVFGHGREHSPAAGSGKDQADKETPAAARPSTNSEPAAAPEAGQPDLAAAGRKKPVTDLNYRIPPESIKSRYVVADGKYLSAANHTTVLFTDSGKKISTAKTDAQTVNDMLEVAKEKGWDSIKISGSKEFKSMMYVAAESRGIRTSGYRPTPEDLALLERLRQERSLNAIEPQPGRAPAVAEAEKVPPAPYPGDKRPRPSETRQGAAAKTAAAAEAGERIVNAGNAPYQHNPKNQPSPYIVLEKDGRERTVWGVDLPDAMARSGAEIGDRIRLHSLGKQPVEIEVAVRDEAGNVTGMEKKEVGRNLFRMEIVQDLRQRQEQEIPPDREPEKVFAKPDVEMLSKADKMLAQNELPSDAAINASHTADTQPGVPLPAIGQSEIRSEAAVAAGRMKTAALETGFIAAKGVYMDKAAKLSKANRQHLQWHERNVLDTIRGLKGDARTLALTNYYEHTAKQMSGSRLKLPKPVKQPAHRQTPANPTTERNQRQERQQGREMEMER
ncbi:LPD7 domain-containing protein [Neisseria musculi]|uniref:Primase C terminal 2 family protein n=1 Tax=Neisseria musculi TaxID=1815583 RepID=A0A7H1M976_9NEIS|nr:PriCT-2 domain-containing protein [Neisseria musculi]QNT58191.1 primase C terminal 2 family protein [Neisseria musculi]